jgi:hypothetical protein
MKFNSKIKIAKWLEKQGLKKQDFHIHDSLAVEIFKNFNLKHLEGDTLPVNFYKVNGDFNCNTFNFKTLKGFPQFVEGNLLFSNFNYQLKNYNYFPKSITNMLILDFFDIVALEKIINIENLNSIYLVGEPAIKDFNTFFNIDLKDDKSIKNFSMSELKLFIAPYMEKKYLDNQINFSNNEIKKIKL